MCLNKTVEDVCAFNGKTNNRKVAKDKCQSWRKVSMHGGFIWESENVETSVYIARNASGVYHEKYATGVLQYHIYSSTRLF